MDIFGTVATAGQIILQFLDACAAYSDEAQSLYHRFKWDLRVIEEVSGYLKERTSGVSGPRPSAEDDVLLKETANYLAVLIGKVTASFSKIQATGILWRNLNKAMWIMRRSELKELELELREWADRFDVRLLGLPPEVKTIIPASTAVGQAASSPEVLQSSSRMQRFGSLRAKTKEQKIAELLFQPSDELAREIEENPDAAFRTLEVDNRQVIFAGRSLPPDVSPGSSQFQKLETSLGELAAALHCLDPVSGVSLLKTEYYFYHRSQRRFLFAHTPPYPVSSMDTLETLIAKEPYPHLITTNWIPLNQRVRLGQKLAEAVFFLHTAGFVHKNITSASIVILEERGLPLTRRFPYSIGDPFLLGFEMVRGADATTIWEGVTQPHSEHSRWQFDIFQHPDRLQGDASVRYIKNYDIYSLGVVLLELGFWEPIEMVAEDLEDDCLTWPVELMEISKGLRPRMGSRYQNAVAWCLGQKGTNIVKDAEFVRQVLDPLEDMALSLS